MVETKSAARYAKSLLGLALERGSSEVVLDDMQLIADVIKNNRELGVLLRSPVIKPLKKSSILQQIFSEKISEVSMQFIEIIVRKGREMYLEGIANTYISQLKTNNNIVSAFVTSAIPLDQPIKEKLLSLVRIKTGKTVELVEVIDSSIIGGYILRVGDLQLDESLSHKLISLKKEFSKNIYVRQF